MGLFNRKNKNEADALADASLEGKHMKGRHANDGAVANDIGNKKKKKKRAKDSMAGLISESVTESAVETMKANTNFVVQKDGEDVFVGMLLKAADIGGLDKKAMRDEDKGSIVELINSGSIAVYVPADLLEAEELVIIPNTNTLAAMDEFPLLTDAPYETVIVNEEGEIERLGFPITYEQASGIATGDDDVYGLLADNGVEWAQMDEPEDDVEDNASDADETQVIDPDDGDGTDDVIDDEGEVIDENDFTDEVPSGDGFDDESENDVADEPVEDDATESDAVADDGDAEDAAEPDGTDDEETEEDEGPVVDEEQVRQAVKFRFYSDELGLEVDGSPFDAQFMAENPYVPFNESRGEGWLNQYLNEMSRDANMFMRRLHQQNLLQLREKYYSLISMHCEKIQRDLDTSDPTTQYGRMSAAIAQHYVESKAGMADIVGRRRDELTKAWDSMLEQVGEDAAHAAKQQYRERYGRQHSDEMMRVETDTANRIEADRQSSIRDMNVERRDEAKRLLDYGIIETLKTLSEEYTTMLADEKVQYDEWRNRINTFLDEHRKDDVAHDKALAEELAQGEKADRVMKEYTERLAAEKAGFEQRRVEMQADIEHIKRDNEKRIADIQLECDNRVKEMQSRLNEQQSKYDVLVDKFAELDKIKNDEFSNRLAEANDQKAAWQSKCDDIIATHKRSNMIMVALCIVVAIASLCVGAFVGTQLNLSFGSEKASSAISQEFNDRMDNVEKDSKSSTSSKTTTDSTTTDTQQSDGTDAAK